MKIHVHYFGQLRQIADRASEELELSDGADVVAAMKAATSGRDASFARLLLRPDGSPSASLMMLVNNELVPRGHLPRLSPGDTLTLIPAISGG